MLEREMGMGAHFQVPRGRSTDFGGPQFLNGRTYAIRHDNNALEWLITILEASLFS